MLSKVNNLVAAFCLLVSIAVSVSAATDSKDAEMSSKEMFDASNLVRESFGQDKTQLIKELLDKAGDYIVNGNGATDWAAIKAIPYTLYFATESGTYEEWQMVVKHIKGEDWPTWTRLNNLTLLHIASSNKKGGLEIVRHLVEKCNLDVNAKTDQGFTPLFGACAKVTEYLVSKGADVNMEVGWSPLTSSIYGGKCADVENCRMLLKLGANPAYVSNLGHTPLSLAADCNEYEHIPVLLEALKGHKVQMADGSEELQGNWVNRRVQLPGRQNGTTPLALAVAPTLVRERDIKKQLATIKALIAGGADVNQPVWGISDMVTPIFLAKSPEVLNALLDAGASMWSPDMETTVLYQTIYDSNLPSGKNSAARVETLLKRGANPFALPISAYKTALKCNARSSVIDVLKKYRADFDPR